MQQVEGEARMAIEMVPKRKFKPKADFVVPMTDPKSKDLKAQTADEAAKTRKKK